MADYTKEVRKILSTNGFHVARKGKGEISLINAPVNHGGVGIIWII